MLSEEEKKLDCGKLTGRMQIRILELRDHAKRTSGSSISAALQSAVEPLVGGTSQRLDQNAQYARDRAMLEAYNGQLQKKGCRTFNLDAELQSKDFRETPRPQ